MKLRDLRELYHAPKDDLDDLDDPEGAPASQRATIGVDLAFGPDKSVATFKCDRCNDLIVLPDMPQKAILLALCPKCDGCALCGRCYDVNGDPLERKSMLAIGIVDGDIVEKHAKVCAQCMDSEAMQKAGFVLKKGRP